MTKKKTYLFFDTEIVTYILSAKMCHLLPFQGVISVSGVYDLQCLNGRFLKSIYLHPTFGSGFKSWQKASPIITAKTTENTETSYLLLSAAKDLFLKQQSLDFHDVLETKGINSKHVEIRGTNHFSIITGTRTDMSSMLGVAIDFIKTN